MVLNPSRRQFAKSVRRLKRDAKAKRVKGSEKRNFAVRYFCV
jgi:hypothetical protein